MEKPKFNPGDIVIYAHSSKVQICKVDAIDYCNYWYNFGQGPSLYRENNWFYRLVDNNGKEVCTCTDGEEFNELWSITLIERSFTTKKWIKNFNFC